MTIRLLEDGDYRLNQDGCIRDLQQSARQTQCCALRTLENGGSRIFENLNRCIAGASTFTATYVVTGTIISLNIKIVCVAVGDKPCSVFYYFAVFQILPTSYVTVKVVPCIDGGDIDCGNSDNYLTNITKALPDGNYMAACYVCSDPLCSDIISTKYAYFDVSTA